MKTMIRQCLVGAALIAAPMAASAQTAMMQLQEHARSLGVEAISANKVPAVQVQTAAVVESLPICSLEERWATVPWTKRYHAVYQGGRVFSGESVKGFDTLIEGIGLIKTLREHGICRVDPKREACRISDTGVLTGKRTFDVDFGGSGALRGRRIAQCASLEHALSVVNTLRAAQLCL